MHQLLSSADHINVVLNTALDAASSGSKIVFVDDGGADAIKLVCANAADFAEVLARYAGRIKVVKLKGAVSQQSADAFGAALAAAILASTSSAEGTHQPIEEVVTKGATFASAAVVHSLAVIFSKLPAGASITPVKKVTLTAGSTPDMEAQLERALTASIVAGAADDSGVAGGV